MWFVTLVPPSLRINLFEKRYGVESVRGDVELGAVEPTVKPI